MIKSHEKLNIFEYIPSFVFLLVFFNIYLFAQDKVLETRIEVTVGIDKIYKLDFYPSAKIDVGDESRLIYRLLPDKKEIVFKGLRTGETSLTLRNPVGDVKKIFLVSISSTSQSKVVQELNEFLGDIEGIDIGIKASKVYVGGEIVVPGDLGKMAVILGNESYKDVLKLYELSPHTQQVIARKMQQEINNSGLNNITIRIVNKIFWIEGVARSSADKSFALRIAEGYLPDKLEDLSRRTGSVSRVTGRPVIQNFIKINPPKAKPPPSPKMIKITAQFVELLKDYLDQFGIKWAPLLNASGGQIRFGRTVNNGIRTKSDGTLSGTISNLLPKLASAKNAGFAKIIRSGMIIDKNNSPSGASIEKTATIPFSVGTGEFQQAKEVKTGFKLSVKSRIVQGEKVEMGVNLGVSLENSNNGSISNNIKSVVIVKSKETAVLGGISFNDNQLSFDKTPPFGESQFQDGQGTPLFSFLKSKDNKIIKSQFVVFVTPEIIESASAGTQEIKQKFKQRSH